MLGLLPLFLEADSGAPLFFSLVGVCDSGLFINARGITSRCIYSCIFIFHYEDACAALLEELKLKVQRGAVSHTGGSTVESHRDSSPAFVLVVDGSTLDWALQEELKGDLLDLSCGCRTVICCRSTPLQKSQVVRFIKDKLGVMTLAVGEHLLLIGDFIDLTFLFLVNFV